MRHVVVEGVRAMRAALAALLVLHFALTSASQAAERPVVAAAASFRDALDEIAALFQRKSGNSVRLSYGATGNLLRQIEEGAPFELFLAADEASVAKLAAAGKTDGQPSVLVRGRLALAAIKGSPVAIDEQFAGLKAALAAGKVRHFAIANPELAPYGRAAREALQHAGLWEEVSKLLVAGENVGQTAQFIATGAAEAGLVAQSLTIAPEFAAATTTALVPEDWHAPVNQSMVLLKGAGAVARDFAVFLKSQEARAVFEKTGFTVP